MVLRQVSMYYDDIFDLVFTKQEDCIKFEDFCIKLKVVDVKYGTDFTEGKLVLPQRGIIVVDTLVYEMDKLYQMVEYFLESSLGSHYDCLGGRYSPTNILPRWEYNWNTELDKTVLPFTLLGIISDTKAMRKQDKISDNKQLGSILKSYFYQQREE